MCAGSEWLCLAGALRARRLRPGHRDGGARLPGRRRSAGERRPIRAPSPRWPLPWPRRSGPSSRRAVRSAVVAAVAEQHLAARPRRWAAEPGPSRALYTRGRQGDRWPWCAAFVSRVIRQVAAGLAVTAPLGYTLLVRRDGRRGVRRGPAGPRRADRRPSRHPRRQRVPDVAGRPATGRTPASSPPRPPTGSGEHRGNTNDSGSRDGDAVLSPVSRLLAAGFHRVPAYADG